VEVGRENLLFYYGNNIIVQSDKQKQMKALIVGYKKLLLLASFALLLGVGMVAPATVTAATSVPAGCTGGGEGPKAKGTKCPKVSKKKSDLKCSSDQTVTKANDGYWFCKDKPSSPDPGGAGGAGGDGGGGGDGGSPGGTFKTGDSTAHNDVCGEGDDAVNVSINIGCSGKGNPITDMVFAIIRILSDGVGLVVIGSIIVGGIQYTASRGDPQSTAMAVNRIRSSVFALIIYIFGYAILNFIIPQGFFQ